MNLIRLLLSLAFALPLLTGCAGLHEPIKTERTNIPGKSVDEVRAASISFLVSQGWTIKQSDPLMLRFEKEAPMAEQFLYNRAGSASARDRLSVTLLAVPSGVDVLGHLVVVYPSRGGDQENSTDQSNRRGRFAMSCLRASLLGEPLPKPPRPERTAPARTGKGSN